MDIPPIAGHPRPANLLEWPGRYGDGSEALGSEVETEVLEARLSKCCRAALVSSTTRISCATICWTDNTRHCFDANQQSACLRAIIVIKLESCPPTTTNPKRRSKRYCGLSESPLAPTLASEFLYHHNYINFTIIDCNDVCFLAWTYCAWGKTRLVHATKFSPFQL